MESGNGSASGKGVLIPVSESSDVFQSCILAPLQSAYLYEESKQSFRYKSAVLVKNPVLEEKYNSFRTKLRNIGYSDEDLQESYGFLLFDDISKAKSLGETGVLAGNSTCTTLGDPSKGVYISMYADCLDLNRWYHGKSGYIAIIRLTKGRVKKVLENYTQNFLEPTVGFDCHVSEQLPSVSDKTSSFLAFERTQYYVYELLDDGSHRASQSPSAACPFAIVSFSYTDTKSTLVVPQEKSEEKALVCHYLPWRGQLQIGTQFYSVGLRSTTGALIPVKLPPVVKVKQAFSTLDLRQLLPKAVFETRFSGEAFLDGFYCTLCELVPSEAEDTSSLTQLLQEIKEKDLVLVTPLNDGGFLILLHSCHFLAYDDTGSSASEVLQGLFVFPDSRVVVRDIKFGYRNSSLSSEILRLLPVITYAEGEVEKTPIDPSEDVCEALMQHMQSYAALINPGLAISPSREVNCFPYQYDVPDAYKDLYSSPEWTNRAWQSIKTYLSKPASFQLPISKASEILATGQEEQREDFDDCVYICLSSPETPTNSSSMGLEDRLSDQKPPETVETSVDSGISVAEAQVDLTAMSQNVVPDDLQAGHATKDSEKCSELSELNKSDDMGLDNLLTPPTSEDLPTELIVSITSAERSVTDETLSVASTVSATKHNDFPLSGFSTIAKLQTAELTSLGTENDKTKRAADCPEVTNLTQTKQKKLQKGIAKGQKKLTKAFVEASTSQTVKTSGEVDNLNSQNDMQAMASSDHQQLSNPSKVYWRKIKRRKRIFGKLSAKNKKARSVAAVGVAVAKENKSEPGKQNLETPVLMELEACPLRKKTERWDLKPVISECGRILVPHGSIDVGDQIKSLKEKFQSAKDEQCPENTLLDAHSNTLDTVAKEQESSSTPETTVDETEAKSSNDGTHPQNVIVSHVNPEQTVLEHSGCNGSLPEPVLSSMAVESVPQSNGPSNDLDSVPSQAVQEKPSDVHSRGKGPTKCESMLTKLKSILLSKKRKADIIGQEETTENTVQETEPCLKKGKVDSYTETFNKATVESTNADVKEVSEMLSVDPLFAYALGLTPKVSTVNAQETEDQNTQQKEESTEEEKQISLDKQLQIPQRPLSIFPRRGRIKTLKKHQGISADNVKKKWWLHFQTPACYARENLKYKDCTSDNSVRKTNKEKMNSACSSTDALNLLADLALSVNNDQVPPQPNPAVERKPETGLKKCDLTKGLSSAEQESVLHALLKQPAARSNQPIESSSPRHLLGDSELVELVSKEHAYSLPPSSFLLLGLPGTPFQVPPLSGSTRLLHHHQTMYGDGIKTLHTSVSQGDRGEINVTTPEYPKKLKVRRQKFRHSRTFVNKEGSVQVTRQWQANYDFNFDSKFTSDAKEKTINRALHGPWDFSIQDTNEEVRLIIHMWIGLFYSRSTDRFIHVDSNLTFTSSEESGSLEITRGMVSGQAKSEVMANCFASFPNVMETSDPFFPKALDLSKKDHIALDQESVILDFSRKSKAKTVTSNLEVNRQETCVSSEQKEPRERLNGLKSPPELQEASTSQCYREMVHSTEMSQMADIRSIPENEKAAISSQKAAHIECTDAPSESVYPDLQSVHAEPESVSADQESVRTDPESVHMVKESLPTKLEELYTELGSICTEPESIHADLESASADVESAGADVESAGVESAGADVESAGADVESVESAGADVESAGADVESAGADLESDGADLESVASPESVCSEQGSARAEQESIHTEPESVHTAQESLSAKLEGLCTMSRSICPETESIPTELQSSSADLKSVGAKQESVHASLESTCSEQGSVCAEQESIHTDPETVHTAQESFPAKLEDLCAKPGSICTEPESIHTEMEIAGAALESVCVEPDSVHAELENICTDPKVVHSMQERFSAKLEGVNTEPESVGAELDSVYTTPKSISDLDTICFKKKKFSTKMESVSIEKASVSIAQESVFPETESAEPESASVKQQDVCGMQESSCTVKEAVSTDRDSVGAEPETNCSHLEGAYVGKESICAEEKGVLPESEGLQTEPEGVCTLMETVSTERDNVGTQPESICSHLEGACVGQESRCAVEEVVLPEPEGVQTKPEGVCTLTETVSTEWDNVGAQQESICSHPEGARVGQESGCGVEEGVHPELEGVQTELEGVCTLMETVSTERDNVDAQLETICSHLGSVFAEQESRCAEEEGILPEPDDIHLETEGVCKLTETVSTEWDSVGHESISSRLQSVYTGLEGVCAKPETIQTVLEFGQLLHKCNKENRDVKDGTENYRDDTTEMSLVPKDGINLSRLVADKVDFKDIHMSPFKNKVFGVEIQQKKAQPTTSQHSFERTDQQETSVGQDCHFYKWFSLTGCMQVIKPKTDQDIHKTTSHSNSNQRPVMAVKPSKSEELQADFTYRDLLTENSVEMKPTKAPVVTNTSPTSILMEKTKEISKEIFEGRSDDKQKANELSSKRTWLPNVAHSKSNTDGAEVPLLDPSCQYQGWDTTKFNIIPSSSLSMLPSESTNCPKVFDKNQGFWADHFVEKTEQTTNSEQLTTEMDEEDWPHETTSIMGPKDDGIADDSHILEPQTSLVCTIFNTSRKRSYPFLEQLSRRCLQDDLTQASVEQECLIFSEQMKQLLKKNKRGASHLQDKKSSSRLSCASPLTIHFSALEEQEDSLDHRDMSLVGQKIKVDMSDRKDLSEETLLSQGPSQRTCNPLEHAGVSGVTTGCARLYEAKMHDVCSFKKVPSRSKGFKRDRSHPKTKISNYVDLCDQMNREMEASFRNNLNTVVKKSCKTKYRFYMLVTSDDVFFDDTKAHLEAEGHTAVQPSDFFLGEDSSSSLLIILRNEDIAEHLCEIPHLLELKKSPGVKFVGIDEPDDVMNLTYQELFTRGGFIMFDRAVLESLSLCNMKKIYEILQDSSTMGKWKWMLHYRDSRRLKENARLSTEAKDKKRFLYWGQDSGILDVLPYHECDTISRDEPDYRSCLVRLQVQNISSRYAIFITDKTTDGTFERNGILTVTLNTFLTTSLNT